MLNSVERNPESRRHRLEEVSGFHCSHYTCTLFAVSVLHSYVQSFLYIFISGHTQNHSACHWSVSPDLNGFECLTFSVCSCCETLIFDAALLRSSMAEHEFLTSQICATHFCLWPSKSVWHDMKFDSSLFSHMVNFLCFSPLLCLTAVLCCYHLYCIWIINPRFCSPQ